MIQYILEANVLLLLFFGGFEIIARFVKSFRLNRVGYVLVVVLSLAIPLIQFEVGIPKTESIPVVLDQIVIKSLPNIEWGIQLPSQQLIIWLSIVLIGIFPLIKVFLKLKHLHFNAVKGYYLCEDADESFSFFKFIGLKKGLEKDERELILFHELHHVKHRHSLDVLLLTLVRGLFFFNPAYYGLKSAMQLNHEYLADAESAKKFGDFQYAKCMLAQTLNVRTSIIYNTFSSTKKSTSFKRLKMLNLKNQKKMKKLMYLLMLPFILGTTAFATVKYHQFNWRSVGAITSSNNDEETPPEFKGGKEALFAFIMENVNYPKDAIEKEKEGTVYVGFVVRKTGELSQIAVKKSNGTPSMDKEAVRVVEAMPNWIPGKKAGKPVDAEMVLPIQFKL